MAEKTPESGGGAPPESSKSTAAPASDDNDTGQSGTTSQHREDMAAAVTTAEAAPAAGPDTGTRIALGLSIVALLAAGFAWYQAAVTSKLESGLHGNRVDALEQRMTGLQAKQEEINAGIGDIRVQVDSASSAMTDQQVEIQTRTLAAEQSLQNQSDDFRAEFQELSDSILDLRSELGRSVESWSLEEVEQLMIIANQRLQLSADAALAAQALALADEQLQQLSDPALSNVRRILAEEIATLQGVKAIDVEGVIFALAALGDSVGGLPLADEPAAGVVRSGSDQADAGQTGAGSGLFGFGREFLADLGSLVQIEKDGEPAVPLLSAEMRVLIEEKTRLILETAQLAMMQGEGEIYRHRIRAAENWVRERFDTESAEVKTWLAALAELAAESPAAELPDVSGSLQALRDVMNRGS